MASNSFQMREIESSLEEHSTQLQQVESALEQTPENEELLQLKSDLEQLIGITQVLLHGGDGSKRTSETVKQTGPVKCQWKKGDRCLAKWSKDGQHYSAVVIDMTSGDDKCIVKFESYKETERVSISDLKFNPLSEAEAKLEFEKRAHNEKRKRPAESKEYKKLKALKKEQKYKEKDEASAKEIRRWQDFRSKTSKGKMLSAKQKRSIFSVPDAIEGKVGVGTCNVGGKPMTAYEYPKTHKY